MTHPAHRSTELTPKSAMLCPSLAREGRNVRFADGGVSPFEYTTITNSYYLITMANVMLCFFYPDCRISGFVSKSFVLYLSS